MKYVQGTKNIFISAIFSDYWEFISFTLACEQVSSLGSVLVRKVTNKNCTYFFTFFKKI